MINYCRISSKIAEKFTKKTISDECRPFIREGAKIIDIGCGSGWIAKAFSDFFKAEVIGTDVKDNRIYPIPFKLIENQHLSFNDGYFDTALIICVLHHLKDPSALLKEAKRVARSVIIYEDIAEGFFSKLACSIHIFFSSRNKFYPTIPNTQSFLKISQWEDIFNSLGFSVISKKKVRRFMTEQVQFVLRSK